MSAIETTQTVPLNVWEDGSIRLSGSRVTLDSIVHNFQLGASAEEIADNFAPLSLADVYAAITYYLTHRDQIEEYLRLREVEGDVVQASLESDPQYREAKTVMRERLLARWDQRQKRE
jgi:uncharacterized protein (DUF433 family)